MKTTTRRRGVAALIIAVLAMFLSGCMRMHMDITVNADDTVGGSFVFAVSDEAAQQAGMTPQDAWDSLSGEASGSMPAGMTETPYAQDGYTGAQYTMDGMPLASFGGGMADSLTITKENGEYIVTGVLDMTSEEDMAGANELMADMDARVSVTLPYGITETNGQQSGNTATWIPAFGESIDISVRGPADGAATGDPGTTGEGVTGDQAVPVSPNTPQPVSDGFPWLWVGIGVGALLLIGIITALVLANKKKNTAGAPYGQAPHGQPGQWGAPQQYPQQGQAQPGQQQWGGQPQQGQAPQWGQTQPGQPPHGQQPPQQWG